MLLYSLCTIGTQNSVNVSSESISFFHGEVSFCVYVRFFDNIIVCECLGTLSPPGGCSQVVTKLKYKGLCPVTIQSTADKVERNTHARICRCKCMIFSKL